MTTRIRFAFVSLVVVFLGFECAAFASDKRVFCESADDVLPHVSFDFYPYDRSAEDDEGSAVLSVDHGLVLDLKQYRDLTIEFFDDAIRFVYPDGTIEFVRSDEFANKGVIQHLAGGVAFVEDLVCYRSTVEILDYEQ